MKISQDIARNVTILADRFWPDNYGGVERHLLEMTRAFVRRGVGVTVLTENRTGAPEHETLEPGLNVWRFPVMDAGPLWRWREWVRVMWWKRIIAHAPAGPLWCREPIGATAAVLAGRRTDLIFNPAGCAAAMDLVSRRHPLVTSLRHHRGQVWLDRYAFRHAPRVVLGSENLARQYEQFYGEAAAIEIVRHGAPEVSAAADRDAIRDAWGIDRGAFVIGFVGRLDPCKGLDFLLSAVHRATPDKLRILVTGDGPDGERLKALAASQGLAGNMVWTGKLDDPTPAYRAMDVFVLPSVYEAFGNVVPEAMAHGVPVIGRHRDPDPARPVFTACDELIADGKSGFVVDPHDPLDLGDKLAMLSRMPDVAKAMGEAARKQVRGQTWDRAAAAYVRMLGGTGAQAGRRAA